MAIQYLDEGPVATIGRGTDHPIEVPHRLMEVKDEREAVHDGQG
jgi:hypothetical protein